MMTIEESVMPSNRSLELAAQAWCTDTTSNRIMDSDLAVAFAQIIDEQRDDMRERAAKLIKEKYEYIHCSDEISKDIENLK